MKYTISMRVDGRIDVEVEAETPEEAFKKADEAFMNLESADLADIHIVDATPVNCTDPDGNLTDF